MSLSPFKMSKLLDKQEAPKAEGLVTKVIKKIKK